MRSGVLLAVAAVTGVMLWLAASLPRHAFYSGDSGVKLIAADNAARHPLRPLEIDLPTIGGTPVGYVERFFLVHGSHAHVLQSPFFPVASAAFVALFGVAGAYVLPVASFVALLPLLEALRRRLMPGVPARAVLLFATLVSPLVFYGLEFWEHMPATACLAGATALALAPRALPQSGAGAAAAAAILLRPEAVFYAMVLAAYAVWKTRRPTILIGFAVVLAPVALYQLIEFGNPLGPHIAANTAPLWDNWASARVRRVTLWLIPQPAVTVPALLLLAVAAALARLRPPAARRAQAGALVVAAGLAVVAALGHFGKDSLWHVWPAGFLLFVPAAAPRPRILWLLAGLPVAAIVLTSTHDGGAQWGPRFLLVCAPPLLLLAASAFADALQPGELRRVRIALIAIVLLAGAWTSRAAFRELRGTKQIYAALVDKFERAVPPGTYVVSNAWWLDQVVAVLHGTRTFLFAADLDTARGILRQLDAAGGPPVTLVWSQEGEYDALDPAAATGCYQPAGRQTIGERQLVLLGARCAPRSARRW